jgi:peptidoglycan/LPS O-acetylase OafA/YrhL
MFGYFVTMENNKKPPLAESSFRLLELDALRGLAAISVLLYHYTTGFDKHIGPHNVIVYFPHGGLGVNLFFIISGFVIFMTLKKVNRSMDFIVSRFSRLFPAYWVAGILTFMIVSIGGLSGLEVSLKDALINLTMLANWFTVPYIDPVYWTLSVELSFYVIMLIIYRTNMLKNIDIIAIVWLIIIFIIRFIKYLFNLELPMPIIISICLWWANFFIAGIMFYKIKNKKASLINHIIIIWCYIYCISLKTDISQMLINAVYFGFFYFFCYGRLSFIVRKSLLFLGLISYPLYLIHANVGYVIIRNLNKIAMNPNISVMIATVCALSLAWLIHRFVEKPAMQVIRKKYKAATSNRHVLAKSPRMEQIK